jgi:hypothetical protein
MGSHQTNTLLHSTGNNKQNEDWGNYFQVIYQLRFIRFIKNSYNSIARKHNLIFFCGTGILNFGFYCLSHIPPVHFALVILEMESYELFAWAGLKPLSSLTQPSK